jgi:hypothetical protein
MDFMASTTILLSGVWISNGLVGGEASSQIGEETASGVTTCTARFRSLDQESGTASVQ